MPSPRTRRYTLARTPALCHAAMSDNILQRFVLAEYIKASQVETGQLVEFISESAALWSDLTVGFAMMCDNANDAAPQKRTICRLTGSQCSCLEVSSSNLLC